jgi:FtsZ-binding cell division protein ZapB
MPIWPKVFFFNFRISYLSQRVCCLKEKNEDLRRRELRYEAERLERENQDLRRRHAMRRDAERLERENENLRRKEDKKNLLSKSPEAKRKR